MRISQVELNKSLRWYVRQPEVERVAVHDDKTRIYRRILNDKRSRGEATNASGEVDYQAFTEAVYKRYRLHCGNQDNRKDLKGIEEIRINVMKASDKKKSAKVRDKISTDLFQTIKKLREEDLSWQKISKYIAKYHKRTISKGYLCKIYTEMEREVVIKEPV